ncbi:carbohydrate ABC transporter permease [Nocardia vaccinii]|uniref:carbohydrate ABC transporter permease n=1 Tax=Nocardia vaccinii TaxID=1822 RepID=UPI00082C5BC3|nr:carbohydrate ABC transporter permease [Nocardia vaccinii]
MRRAAIALGRRTGLVVLVGVIVLWSLAPFAWQVITSLEPDRYLAEFTPHWLPFPGATLQHYRNVFGAKDFTQYVCNSAIVDAFATVVAVVLATAAAYAVSLLWLRGRGWIVALVLAVSMLPQVAIVTPAYQELLRLHLLNSYLGLGIVYAGLSLPLTFVVLSSHLRGITREIHEAARLDGAGPIRTLWSVIVPLALPGIVPAALLGFIASWNELLLALSLNSDPDRQTVPVAIANFTGIYAIPWGDIAAASVVTTVPLVVLVLIGQRRIVAGLTAAATTD